MPWDFWLIFLFLAVILPWRGRSRLKKLLEKADVGTSERLSLYASTIAFQWLAVAVVGWRAWAHGYTPAELGLVLRWRGGIAIVAILGAAILAAAQWFNLRRMGKISSPRSALLQALAQRLFPQSGVEQLPYFALAVTAGLCEEFLYRGFAMAALTRGGLPNWSVVLLSAVLFGLAHIYQGRGGFVSTLVIGTVFGTARIAYDSLAPVMVWHAAVDVVAGIAGPKYLSVKANTVSEPEIQSRSH
ncbi:MAG TPA: CPBP family intramembrane glutamic endopeptidase [Candidatus Acidoferrales bacterium]|nr:CPBP family intramembrane glutamic endopeptidase [Candidatus Acidoferrales bacterium]